MSIERWRTTISHKWTEPIKPHSNTTRYFDPIKQRLVPNALIFKRTSTIRRGIRTNNKALTFPMQSVLQKVHHVRNNELIFMYDTQRKAKQTFTWFFLAQISQIPTTSKETGQSKLFWWICKTLFSTFSTAVVGSWGFTEVFHMIRREVFIPRITTQHWYPYSFDANQVC